MTMIEQVIRSAVHDNFPPYFELVPFDGETEKYAQSILAAHERERYERVPEEKRHAWLCGRVAAKRSASAYLRARGFVCAESEIIVVPGSLGKPTLTTTHAEGSEITDALSHTSLSISHCEGLACAQVVDRMEVGNVGVDIETVREWNEDTVRAFLTESEYECYRSAEESGRPFVATWYWCLKEAFLKARGVGIRTHPQKVATVVENDQAVSFFENGTRVPAQVYWTVYGDLYMLVSITLI